MMLLFISLGVKSKEFSRVDSALHSRHRAVLWCALNEGQWSRSVGALTDHLWYAIPGAQHLSKSGHLFASFN